MTADGTDDHRIKLEGVPKGHKFTFYTAAGWVGRGAWVLQSSCQNPVGR